MKLLPQYPPLVNLEIIEIYEYYDFPCLFSCQNASGQIFLAVWIDEIPDHKTWLYSPMSKGRLKPTFRTLNSHTTKNGHLGI
ncbi:MAG: DUF6575 domain-containing protein [Dolichospermum sp.]